MRSHKPSYQSGRLGQRNPLRRGDPEEPKPELPTIQPLQQAIKIQRELTRPRNFSKEIALDWDCQQVLRWGHENLTHPGRKSLVRAPQVRLGFESPLSRGLDFLAPGHRGDCLCDPQMAGATSNAFSARNWTNASRIV